MSERKASMKSKELSVDFRDRIVSRHRSGEGYRRISAALKVSMSTVASIIRKWKKFGTTRTLPRAGRPSKLSTRGRGASAKEVPLSELQREPSRRTDERQTQDIVKVSASSRLSPSPQKSCQRLPESLSIKKENSQSESSAEDKTSLSSSLSLSHHEDEQDESSLEISEPSMCPMCEHSDSLLKTKKQCKNCSGVFCESCVSKELPLPSSILPETVCTACYSLLLQRHSIMKLALKKKNKKTL